LIQFDKHILDRSQQYYLGFSGGPDSTAAAHFLKQGGFNLTLLHVQHFNTPESIRIKDECEKSAKALGIPFFAFRGFFVAENRNDTSEAAAHAIRSTVINSRFIPTILCNHLDDMAEGYFMNCINGTPNRVPLVARHGLKVRPFLRTRKAHFGMYLAKHGLTDLIVRDDMLGFRGVIRKQIFPLIETDLTSVTRRLFVDTGLIYKEY
jgi:tRNA(Ile)-lysidine synthase TilS/MesJ